MSVRARPDPGRGGHLPVRLSALAPVLAGDQRRFDPVACMELLQDRRHVMLHRLLLKIEFARDLLVAQARGKTYFDTFRAQIATFIGREDVLMEELQQAAEEATAAAAENRKLIAETAAWVDHTNDVIATANQILMTAVDMETGMRGFLLAGQEEFLDPYNAGHDGFDALITALQQTVGDNPAQVELLQEIRKTIDDYFRQEGED